MLDGTHLRPTERARKEADRQRAAVRDEIGNVAVTLTEEYFPEKTRARRRQTAATAFVAGLLVGILLRHLLSRSSGSAGRQ